MERIITYINDNAIIASLIAIAINTIIQIVFRRNDKKYNEKKERDKEKRREFLNKAEFNLESKKWDSKEKPDICLFVTDFGVTVEDSKYVEFHYHEDVLDKNKYKHIQFYIKNVGKADVNQLNICSASQERIMLCNVESIKLFYETKTINYNYCYDRRIQKNQTILVDIAYLENSKIFSAFSSELLLLFKDSYGNMYRQLFFIVEKKLYEASPISYKNYRECTTTNNAIKNFKRPWLR